jgi:diadenosine tetraphosphate (Ap4A) HIT family hydrolase
MREELIDQGQSRCCFCAELAQGKMPDEFVEKSGIVNRVISESENFVAVPSISPLSPGHVLVVSKQHITSLSQLEQGAVGDLCAFADGLIEAVTANFRRPILFEHGVGRGKVGGCGVNHAHLHIVPLQEGIGERVQSTLFNHFCFRETTTLEDFLQKGDGINSYLIFGLDKHKMFYCFDESVPSQFVRRILATETENRSWDWKMTTGWADFARTYKCLSVCAGHPENRRGRIGEN